MRVLLSRQTMISPRNLYTLYCYMNLRNIATFWIMPVGSARGSRILYSFFYRLSYSFLYEKCSVDYYKTASRSTPTLSASIRRTSVQATASTFRPSPAVQARLNRAPARVHLYHRYPTECQFLSFIVSSFATPLYPLT